MNKLDALRGQRAEAEADLARATSDIEERKPQRGPLMVAIRNRPTKKLRADLGALEVAIAAAGVRGEQAVAEIAEIDERIHLLEGEAEYAVAVAAKERLNSIMGDQRVSLARRIDKHMDTVVKDFDEWHDLSNGSALEAETVGLVDSDTRLVSKGVHISNYIRWRLERPLGPDTPRAHRAFWMPLEEIESDFARLTKQSCGRTLKKLRRRLGLPAEVNENGSPSSTKDKTNG